MTDTTKKARKRKAPGPFSDELLDQLLAQVSGKDAESLLGESGLIEWDVHVSGFRVAGRRHKRRGRWKGVVAHPPCNEGETLPCKPTHLIKLPASHIIWKTDSIL